MIRNSRMAAVAGAALSVALALGSGAASAQTGGKHGSAVKGQVLSVGSGSLQVQTATGTVSVPFTSTTRVEKIVAGTTADLVTSARVEVTFAAGTTTVTAIRVEPAFTKPAGTKPVHTRPAGTKPVHTKPATGTTAKPVHSGTRTHAGGQIASFTGSTLTLSGHKGAATTSYTLGNNVSITKVVAGTTGDLAAGQTVAAFVPASGAAVEITILKG